MIGPIKHGDLPLLGFVRHQLPTMCWREETPAPEQKIYSSITIHPDMNILPLHFRTARCIISLTENKCIIRGSSMPELQGFRSVLQPSRFCADTSEPRGARTKTTLFPVVSCRHIFKAMWLTQQVPHQSHGEMKNLSHLVS